IRQHEKDLVRRNDRFFAVPVNSKREQNLDDESQLSARMRQELEQFFIASGKLENKKLEIAGWHGRERALELLDQGVARYRKSG
ncbi:MAG TPA: inorganic diphosphatase, partial [Polyangiaceae bacterium]|nr:inorganic diphosphatase [Polyangiaceae bacterium]